MEIKNYFAQDAQGNIMPSANCYLYFPGTTTLATGLVDGNGIPISNPFLASGMGQITFGAPSGVYDLRVALGARDWTIKVQCADIVQAMDVMDSILGSHAENPATRNNGHPLESGDETWNSTDKQPYWWNGTAWVALNSSAQQLEERLSADGGALKIGDNVVAVDSIATLLTLLRKAGIVYSVESYYAGVGTGGNSWKWVEGSTKEPTFGSVLQVPGVDSGRFEVIKLTRDYTAYEFGVRASNTGTDNRLRLSALYRQCSGTASTVRLIDEDYKIDASAPVIIPGYTTTYGGKGVCHPVFESALPPASTANSPDGTYKCYGGVFSTGDPVSGKRFTGSNLIDIGTVIFIGVKIKNVNKLATTETSFLHGIMASGGTNIYIDCQIDDMPNTGYYNVTPKEVYYYRCKGRGNGFLGPGYAKNGMSNISTYAYNGQWGGHDSTVLSIVECEFTGNKDEGVQYTSFPHTVIRDNNLSGNLDRAIESDNAYPSNLSNRPNDQVHVYGNDCRGVSGVTNYSMTFNDGYSKDVYLGGNILGNCRNVPLISTCTITGSFTFVSRNKFYLDPVGLVNGCHAMYLNAGMIDLRAGGEILGAHSRSELNASMINANNEMPLGGTLLIGAFTSETTFVRAIEAKTSTRVRSIGVVCPTSRCFARLNLVGNASTIEISDSDGVLNSSGSTSDGLINFIGLGTFTVDKLVLKGNLNDVNAATRYPVMTEGATPAAGQVKRFFSFGNYWKGFSFNGGAERLTSVVGLAAKTSALDLPVLA